MDGTLMYLSNLNQLPYMHANHQSTQKDWYVFGTNFYQNTIPG